MMKKRDRATGMTLAEVLVVIALMSLVTTFIISLFTQSQAAFELGSGRMAADQKAREAIRKISPYLSSAFSPLPGGGGALYFPTAPGDTGSNVTISTTEDWLYAGYPTAIYASSPLTYVSGGVYNPTSPGTFRYSLYRVSFVPQGSPAIAGAGDLRLERLVGTAPPYAVSSSRVLVRSTRDAALINATFQRLYDASSVVQVSLQVRSRTRDIKRQERLVDVELRANLNVAAESLRGN